MPAGLADKDQGLAGAEGGAGDAVEVVDETDAADHRSRQDGLAVGLVVERHVAGDDRIGERLAGRLHAVNAADALAHDLRALGIAEIQVVGDREWAGAAGGEVAPALGHRPGDATLRTALAVARRAIAGPHAAPVQGVAATPSRDPHPTGRAE